MVRAGLQWGPHEARVALMAGSSLGVARTGNASRQILVQVRQRRFSCRVSTFLRHASRLVCTPHSRSSNAQCDWLKRPPVKHLESWQSASKFGSANGCTLTPWRKFHSPHSLYLVAERGWQAKLSPCIMVTVSSRMSSEGDSLGGLAADKAWCDRLTRERCNCKQERLGNA